MKPTLFNIVLSQVVLQDSKAFVWPSPGAGSKQGPVKHGPVMVVLTRLTKRTAHFRFLETVFKLLLFEN